MCWLLAGVVVFWTASTPWMADTLVRVWEDPRKAAIELPVKSDVAIVLGGLSNPLSSTDEHLEFSGASERLLEALKLYRDGRVGAVLISSGSGDILHPDVAEAPELARFARQWGVPENALIVEQKSRNTHENAVFTLPLLREHGWTTAVLITSAWHMRRAHDVFLKQGFAQEGRKLVTWPVDTLESRTGFPFNAVPDPAALATVQMVLREMIGWVVYALSGYL